jgi:tetratricopeptide (TPR) repeat protein
MSNVFSSYSSQNFSFLWDELTDDMEKNIQMLKELRERNREHCNLIREIDRWFLTFLPPDRKERFIGFLYSEIYANHREAMTIVSKALSKVHSEKDIRDNPPRTWTARYGKDHVYLIQTEKRVILTLDNGRSEFQHFLVDYFRSLPHWIRTTGEKGSELSEYMWEKKKMGRFQTTPDEIDYLFTFGSALMGHGLHSYAASRFQEILNQDPDDHETLLRLSRCLTNMGHYEFAFHHLRRAVSIEPDDVRAYKDLADCCEALKLYGIALENLLRARDLDQKDWEIHNNIGVAYMVLEEYSQAIEAYEKAMEVAPWVPPIRKNIGLAYEKVRQFDKAIEAYVKYSELEPENHDPHLRIGSVYEEMGDFERAIEAYQKAVEIDSSYFAYLSLGRAYEKVKRLSDARTSYQKALEVWPGEKDASAAVFRLDHPDMGDLEEEMAQVVNEHPFLRDDPDALPVIYEEAKRIRAEREGGEPTSKQDEGTFRLN